MEDGTQVLMPETWLELYLRLSLFPSPICLITKVCCAYDLTIISSCLFGKLLLFLHNS